MTLERYKASFGTGPVPACTRRCPLPAVRAERSLAAQWLLIAAAAPVSASAALPSMRCAFAADRRVLSSVGPAAPLPAPLPQFLQEKQLVEKAHQLKIVVGGSAAKARATAGFAASCQVVHAYLWRSHRFLACPLCRRTTWCLWLKSWAAPWRRCAAACCAAVSCVMPRYGLLWHAVRGCPTLPLLLAPFMALPLHPAHPTACSCRWPGAPATPTCPPSLLGLPRCLRCAGWLRPAWLLLACVNRVTLHALFGFWLPSSGSEGSSKLALNNVKELPPATVDTVLQIEDNMAALAVLPKLTDEVVAKIDSIVDNAWD